MKNTTKKIISALLFMFLTINMLINISIATDSYYDIMMNTVTTLDNSEDSTNTSSEIGNVMTTIIVVTQVIGMGVAFTMLTMVAIKYMTSAPGERAEIKKSAVVYVTGAIILFGVVGILKLLEMFSRGINGG